MATVTLTLPDEAMSLAKQQAAARGFGDWGEYLRALLVQALELGTQPVEAGVEWAGPEHARVRSDDDVKAKLREALNDGPAVAMTNADWDDMRRRLRDRHGGKNGQ